MEGLTLATAAFWFAIWYATGVLCWWIVLLGSWWSGENIVVKDLLGTLPLALFGPIIFVIGVFDIIGSLLKKIRINWHRIVFEGRVPKPKERNCHGG
jgi:hypothetical protein